MQTQSTDYARREECIREHLASGRISIDDEGRVWRHAMLKRGKVVHLPEPRRIDHPTTLGYFAVKLTLPDGTRFATSGHRIQWIRHHGSIPTDREINHKDLDKGNNRIGNLELATHTENLIHVHSLRKFMPSAENHANTDLTWENVNFIREQYRTRKMNQAQLAAMFHVTPTSISLIVNNKRWVV